MDCVGLSFRGRFVLATRHKEQGRGADSGQQKGQFWFHWIDGLLVQREDNVSPTLAKLSQPPLCMRRASQIHRAGSLINQPSQPPPKSSVPIFTMHCARAHNAVMQFAIHLVDRDHPPAAARSSVQLARKPLTRRAFRLRSPAVGEYRFGSFCPILWVFQGSPAILAPPLQRRKRCYSTSQTQSHRTTSKHTTMKILPFLSIALGSIALVFSSVSCKEEKGPAGKVGEKIDDALDARPAEGLRDAAEDLVK